MWKFQPIAFEATGGFSLPALLLVNRISKLVSPRSNIPVPIIQRFIISEISCILLRSASWMLQRKKTDIVPNDI